MHKNAYHKKKNKKKKNTGTNIVALFYEYFSELNEL